MQLKDLLTDDDAVSPVIGVILMVAITVILAAVIAAFVLGLGDTNSVAPNTSFDINYDDGASEIDVRVSSGDTVNSDRLTFNGENFAETGDTWTSTISSATDLQAGDSTTLTSASASFLLEITFVSESGDTSSVIGSREGPER